MTNIPAQGIATFPSRLVEAQRRNWTQLLWPGMAATERPMRFTRVNHIKDLYGTKQAVPALAAA